MKITKFMAIAGAFAVSAVITVNHAEATTNTPSVTSIGTFSGSGFELGGSPGASNGVVYVMSDEAGANGYGEIFAIDSKTHITTDLYDFTSDVGTFPYGGLVLWNNKLFGTVGSGGTNFVGSIFAYDLSSSTIVWCSFAGTGVSSPSAAPLSKDGTNWYGTASSGGTVTGGNNGDGGYYHCTYTPAAGLHMVSTKSLTGGNGIEPLGRICFAPDGSPYFYATTEQGGAYHVGTINKVRMSDLLVTDVYDMEGTNGVTGTPYSLYAMPGDTNDIWGTGANNAASGIIFKFTLSTSTFTVVRTAPNVYYPDLIVPGNENGLYAIGLTNTGSQKGGYVQRFDSAGNFVTETIMPNQTNHIGFAGSSGAFDPVTHEILAYCNFLDREADEIRPVRPIAIIDEVGTTNGTLVTMDCVMSNNYTLKVSTNLPTFFNGPNFTATNGIMTVLDTNKTVVGYAFYAGYQDNPLSLKNELASARLLGEQLSGPPYGSFASYPAELVSTNSGGGTNGPPPPASPDGMSDSDSATLLMDDLYEAMLPFTKLH